MTYVWPFLHLHPFFTNNDYVLIVKRKVSEQAPAPEAERNDVSLEPVDPEDRDPDVLVLGFQELDLSTEALIYSLGTAREDAWCRAVFASLGEKAEKYEKVTVLRIDSIFAILTISVSAGLEATRRDVDCRDCEEETQREFHGYPSYIRWGWNSRRHGALYRFSAAPLFI